MITAKTNNQKPTYDVHIGEDNVYNNKECISSYKYMITVTTVITRMKVREGIRNITNER